MWARVAEIMLSLYIILSPFYYPLGVDNKLYWVSHLICGILLTTFALMSFSIPLRKMHLLSLIITAFLLFAGYKGIYNNIVLSRSDMTLALLLLMINIIPSFSSSPPIRWLRFQKKL